MEMMSAASNERSIELTVLRGPGADTLGSTQAGGAQNFLGSSSVLSSPGRPGVHTGPPPPQQAHKEIRVNKTPTGLDIAIARGGSDELGRSTVVVQHVVPTGNIGRDGRIKEGDTLLSIDGHSLLNIPLEDAARLLAIAKGPPLTAPPHPPGTAEPEPERTVELHHENGGFGLILGGGGPSGAAVRINEVIAGSSAHAAHLQSGQEIVRINGNSVERMSVERVTTMLSIAKVRSGGETTTVTVRSGSEVTLVYVSNRPPPAAAVTTTTTGATYGSQHGSPADPWLVRRSPSPGASLASSRAVSQASLGARDPVDDLAEADPAEAYARMRRDRDQLRQELMRAKQESAVLENRLSLAESANEAARAMERDYDEIITLLEAEVAHLRAQLLASPDDKNRQLIEYRRRCIMLGCQVNKAVEAKKTSDEALDVLTKFARGTKDKLEFSSTTQSKADRGLNVRRDGTLRARPFDGPLPPSGAAWSVGDACMVKPDRDGGAPRLAVVKSIQAGASSVEGYEQCVVEIVEDDHAGGSVQGGGGAGLGLPRREVVGLAELMPLSSSHYAVASARGLDIAHRLPGEKDFLSALERLILQDSNKALAKAAEVLESEVLPFGFEEAFTNDGTRYFIDHVNQTTSFLHPCTKRLPDDSAMSHMRPPTAF